jgi:hypothetical protein
MAFRLKRQILERIKSPSAAVFPTRYEAFLLFWTPSRTRCRSGHIVPLCLENFHLVLSLTRSSIPPLSSLWPPRTQVNPTQLNSIQLIPSQLSPKSTQPNPTPYKTKEIPNQPTKPTNQKPKNHTTNPSLVSHHTNSTTQPREASNHPHTQVHFLVYPI